MINDLLNSMAAFTLWGSMIAFWLFALVVLFIFFYSEKEEEGRIAFVAFLVFIGVTYIWSDFKITSFIFNWGEIATYLGIGLAFASLRSIIFGRKSRNKKQKIGWITRNLKGNVFRWWFIWPVSLLYWIFSDLFKDIWDFLYAKFGKLFVFFVKIGLDGEYEKEEKSEEEK